MADAAVNWEQYFYSIKSVCPWSWAAWRKNQILIAAWEPRSVCKNIPQGCQAVVYVSEHNPRLLKKICNRYNNLREHEEWLWSHPKFKGMSAPVPILIQQDRQTLENARKNTVFVAK